MDPRLAELENQKARLEKEYRETMERYRAEILKLDHEIVELSKLLSQEGQGASMPEDGWNAEHEGIVRNDQAESRHLFEF